MSIVRLVAVITSLLLVAAACGDGRRNAAIIDVSLRDDVALVLSIAACNARDNRADVDETDDAVTIKVTTDEPRGGDACSDSIAVVLDAPLGSRPVIDATSGEIVHRQR